MNKHLSFIQSLSAPLVEIHYQRPHLDNTPKISSPEESIQYILSIAEPNRIDLKEFFWIVLLSNANRVLGVAEICVGELNCTAVDLREIMQLALLTNASNVILAHNHPSGQLKPSHADLALTKRIITAGELLHIKILDHFIITSESFKAIDFEDLH